MIILYVCAYPGNITGGVASVVPQYLDTMSEYANVFVYSDCGLQYKNTKKKYKQIKNRKELLQKINKMDIVVFHEVYYIYYYQLARMLVKHNIPYIIIPHCSLTQGAQEQKKFLKSIVNRLWVNKFIKQACCIQYLSESEKKMSKISPPMSIIIPNGISNANVMPQKKAGQASLNLIFMGRFNIKQKGLDLLVEACSLIKDKLNLYNIHINLYGPDFEGGRNDILKKIHKYKLENNISLYEPVYGSEKQNVLLKNDIYILPSRFEGLPIGILEAMQSGLPVLVTPETGFGEIVQKEECGWCVEGTVDALAEGILRVASEQEKLPKLSQNAVKVVKHYFTWDRIAELTIKEYGNVLDLNGNSGVNNGK